MTEADVAHQDNTTVLAYRVGDDRHCLHITLDQMEAPTKLANAKSHPSRIVIREEAFRQETQEAPKPPGLWTKIRTYMSGTER